MSDLDDYPPGGTVTLTGTGWQPGEVVTIVVNDTIGQSWNLKETVTGDKDGRITLTFILPSYYVSDYDVTATGPVTGAATTTFTDAATGSWRYWMTASAPVTTRTVLAGSSIVYNLCADVSGTSNTNGATCAGTAGTGTASVDNAVATLTLTDNVGGELVKKVTLAGTTGFGSVSTEGGVAVWTLDDGLSYADRSAAVTAHVAADAPAGRLTATISAPAPGASRTGTGMTTSVYHDVTATAGTCDFANPGSGTYANSICWFDMSGFNAAAAAAGQNLVVQNIQGGYKLSYTITSSGSTVNPTALYTYSGAYMGVRGYLGIAGRPALYQTSGATTSRFVLSNISLTDSNGAPVSGFGLVGADAESTDGSGESITWTSSSVLTNIGTLGNSCNSGAGLTGSGTTTVTCTGGASSNKTGMPIVYSENPTTFTQSMTASGGLQGVAFGIIIAGIQLKKTVVNPVNTADSFTISVAPTSGGSALGSATASAATWKADTGRLFWYAPGTGQTLTMSETSTSPANYAAIWDCRRNGVSFSPTNPSGTSNTVSLAFGDLVVCEIINTGPSLTLTKSVNNAGGGALAPGDWMLTATGSAVTVSKAPAQPWTVDGTVTTGSTQTTAVPIGGYALSEASTAPGAVAYTAGTWSCTSSGTAMPLVNNVVTVAAGKAVTCSITNTYVPSVTLQKTWVNGVSGDKADLIIGGATGSPGRVTSTANGDPGPWTDPVNVARTVPTLGSTVSVAETLASTNRGKYTSRLECRDGSDNLITVSSSGTFSMPASNVVCTFTNDGVKPTIAVWKTTTGAFGGPFPFTLTNTVPTTGTATTTEAGTPVQVDADATTSGAQPFTIDTFGVDVTIDEAAASMPSGWVFVEATCTDGTTTVGSLAGTKYTIPAASLNAGAAIRCDYTNRPVMGTVTWSKVDAGSSTTTWLKGSVWTLTGPSHPTGVDVADCEADSAEGCALLATPTIDQDPATGRFSVPGLFYGTYTLVEKTAPVGFRLDTTEHTFSIATDGSIVEVGEIGNERVAVPPLPLTGGPSTDSFVIAGALLLALAAAAAWRQRRRVEHPRS